MTGNSSPHIGRRGFMAGSAGLGLLLATGGLPALAQAQRSGTLKMGTLGLDTADPHRHTGSIGVQQAYVEALTSIAGDGSVEPWLAESFTFSPDGLVYTFKLRPGVKFHNGDPLKAADVVANIERVKTQIKGGWLVTAMKKVAKVEAPDDATVVLTMSESYAPLLNLMSELWILSPKSEGWAGTVSLPIGTGPFTFGAWQPKVSFTAPAFADYWVKGLPMVETVTFDLRDTEDKVLPLQAGDLHIIQIQGLESAQTVQGSGMADVMPLKDSSWLSIAWNNRTPKAPFDDVRVRRALALAVDKAAFIAFEGGETGVVTNQMVAPGNFYFDQAMHDADPFAKPDLEKAKALLGEAGVNPAQHTIRFVSWQRDYAQVIVQMVRKLGFQVEHTALDDLGTQQKLAGDDWDMNVMGSGPRADVFLRWVRLMSDGPNPTLWGNIQDPELDAMIERAVREPDPDKRRAHYLTAMQRVNEKMYFVVLGHTYNLLGVAKTVRGFEPGFTWSPHWASGGIAHTALKA